MVEDGVQVTLNTVRRIDVQLQLANVGQTVTVQADAAVLQTDRADVNHQVTTQDDRRPAVTGTNGMRNFESLHDHPRFHASGRQQFHWRRIPRSRWRVTSTGRATTMNNMKLDGASDVYPWLPQIASYIPSGGGDSIGQHRHQQLRAPNRAGRRERPSTSCMKSGTNQFHGAAWEYNTNDALPGAQLLLLPAQRGEEHFESIRTRSWRPDQKEQVFLFRDLGADHQRSLANVTESIPLASIRGGNFAGFSTIYNPTYRYGAYSAYAFPGDIIPTSMISTAAAALTALIPQPNEMARLISNNTLGPVTWLLPAITST